MPTEDENHEQDLAQIKQRKDKASSQKRQRENGSQMDEESGGHHCCEASANLLEMKAKLNKTLTLFGEIESLKTCLANLEEENKKLKEAANLSKTSLV